MMLSDEDIKEAMRSGALQVTPFKEEFIKGSSVTLHLGSTLLKPRPGVVIDVKKNILPEYDEIEITPEKPYRLDPGSFLLGHTYESVTVGPKLGFLIEGRSTLARIGLTIVQTAMIVNPGHKDRAVTLELANHGPNPILLYPRMRVARVALFELKTASMKSYDDQGGKYRDQKAVGRPIFRNEILEE
jgi:dCTP deaminase